MPPVDVILMNPNDFRPRDIRDIVVNGNLTQEQLQSLEQRLDEVHRKAFKQGERLRSEKVDYDKCLSENVRYEDLSGYIAKYEELASVEDSISGHFEKVRELLRTKEEEKEQFGDLKNEIESLSNDGKRQKIEDFKKTHPEAALSYQKELAEMLNKIDEYEGYLTLENRLKEHISIEGKITAIKDYIDNNPFSAYKDKVEELKKQVVENELRKLSEADEEAWRQVSRIIASPYDPDYKKAELEKYRISFESREQEILKILNGIDEDKQTEYRISFESRKQEILKKLSEIDEDEQIMPTIESVLKNPNSDVIDFIRLVEKYPQKKEHIRNFMLNDMRDNPARYSREEMIWLINGKHDVVDDIAPVFTPDEIVRSGVVSWNIMNHIITHPTDMSDRNIAENEIKPETNFKSKANNTDVYFFGVPGSGKSTVLAGLLNIQTFGDLTLNVLTNGGHSGYMYASILKNYLRDNLFPQSTKVYLSDNPFVTADTKEDSDENSNVGDKFIQIIDAELINHKLGETHELSIIDMPGERTLAFAVAPAQEPMELDDLLGKGTSELFANDNNKVFFFVIDPNPKREYVLPGGAIVRQADVLEALVTFIRKVPGLLSKVHAVHIILSKSDILQDANDFNSINKNILCDYEAFIRGTIALCAKQLGDVNVQCGRLPYLFTFSLGKVFPGNMNEYSKDDAGKILEVIAANTWSTSSKPSRWESIVEYMNK